MTAPKVLIIDDSKSMRFQIKAMLPEFAEVFEAADGISGIRQILIRRPDLVILDCFMPRMNGWQVVNRMLSYPEVSHLPVVLVTGRKDELETQTPHLFDYFIYDYFEILGKPFEPSVLFQAIHRAVDKAKQRHPEQDFLDPHNLTDPPKPSPPADEYTALAVTTAAKAAEAKAAETPTVIATTATAETQNSKALASNPQVSAFAPLDVPLQFSFSPKAPQTQPESPDQLQSLQAEIGDLREHNEVLTREIRQLKQQILRLLDQT